MGVKELLKVSSLSFSYPGKQVLRDINLSLNSGEVLCLMGPNGCGKTTLIDNILAVHKLQQGSITLLGKDISQYKRSEIAQNIAYVPQTHSATFPYTVREIVLMGRTAYTGAFGKPSAHDEKICDKAIERVGISEFADTPYSKLSGGEVKLVLLARALGQGAPIIIMDEPTAFLDCRNELIFLETIADLCKNEGIAVLASTHSPSHAFFFDSLGVKTNAALFAGGTLAYFDSPDIAVTPETIREVFSVNSMITENTDASGHKFKNVLMLGTAEEER